MALYSSDGLAGGDCVPIWRSAAQWGVSGLGIARMRRTIFAWGVLCAAACATFAETHLTGVPALESRPGAAYTIYLDFGGFSYAGAWLGSTTPGVTPAFGDATGGFTAQQQANIANVWARVAEK